MLKQRDGFAGRALSAGGLAEAEAGVRKEALTQKGTRALGPLVKMKLWKVLALATGRGGFLGGGNGLPQDIGQRSTPFPPARSPRCLRPAVPVRLYVREHHVGTQCAGGEWWARSSAFIFSRK